MVIYPDIPLDLTGFSLELRDFDLDNCILIFYAEQVYLKLQVTNIKNEEVTAKPTLQTPIFSSQNPHPQF